MLATAVVATPSTRPARPTAPRPARDRESLVRLRSRIDRIDSSILGLLVERFRVVEDVLRAKRRSGGAVYRPLREHEQLDRLERLASGAEGSLSADAVRAIFGEILSASRALQGSPSIAYLGPEGTFSERAARAQFGSAAKLVPVASIPEVFAAVERGRAQLGIVPIENSTEGMVGPTLDALVSSPLRIVAERGLAVRQALLARTPGLDRIRRIVSHPQSLAQCREWLARRLPDVPAIEVASNAAAAARAARSPSTAAIASRDAARRYGLRVLAEDIQDAANNVTRFVVLAPADAPTEAGADKMSVLFSVRNRPGALYRALEPLARARVDLCKLESRPMRGRSWEYLFFVDLRGAIEGARVRRALASMERESILFKVLGAYAEARSA